MHPARANRAVIQLFAAVFLALFAARLCHVDILWADEDYHQAAAIQILYGKQLYRDVWYDKPPLTAVFYLASGAQGGWVLRLTSALFGTALSFVAFHFADRAWGRREGMVAAALSAFCLIFYFPGATLTLEPDTLMMLPHLAAVYFAWRGRPFSAGIVAGIALLTNVKGAFVLAACALFCFQSLPVLLVGFLLPNALFLGWLIAAGAWSSYWQQVWSWGLLYAASPETVGAGLRRLLNWFGFHAALVIGAGWFWWETKTDRVRFAAWFVISLVAAGIGWRFLPRYMDQLLPPLVIAGSRGAVIFWERRRLLAFIVLSGALLAPAVRFGPRYFKLASEILRGRPHDWADVALDLDSKAAARAIRSLARPGDTIFVWGYRPNVVAYTRMPIASRFWDSQPITGVPADRHLSTAESIAPEWAAANRAELVRSRPTFIADGLSLLNPGLDIHNYPDLADWLRGYCAMVRTSETIIYRRCER
jgi:hypothetical protein